MGNGYEFVVAYMRIFKQKGRQVDLAEYLGVSRQAVQQRMAYYRVRGVRLPALNRAERKPDSRSLDIEVLNDYIEQNL